jgi:hypothetical protein
LPVDDSARRQHLDLPRLRPERGGAYLVASSGFAALVDRDESGMDEIVST